jgi:hypothetical protein
VHDGAARIVCVHIQQHPIEALDLSNLTGGGDAGKPAKQPIQAIIAYLAVRDWIERWAQTLEAHPAGEVR